MRLRPLSGAQVNELVRSLFGDLANTVRLGDWLRGLSGGSPRACLELVQYLIERNVVRYVDGMWVLPIELSPKELPDSLDQVMAARLSRLQGAERKLAEALSVHHGKLSLARCL